MIAENYPISGNVEIDQVLYIIIGVIAFVVAFDLVGIIFDFFGCYDSKLMSEAHWGIRLAVLMSISWILRKVFEFIDWLFSFPFWVYICITVFIILVVILVYYINYRNRKLRNTSTIEDESKGTDIEVSIPQSNTINISNEILQYSKSRCPRCGGELIKRNGPYGSFWGCNNYRGNEYGSCKYTRSFL